MKKPIWFKIKTYGWGWTPATWQGWLIIAVYIALVTIDLQRINAVSPSGPDMLIYWIPDVFLLTMILLLITWLTGEKPGWHWGKGK